MMRKVSIHQEYKVPCGVFDSMDVRSAYRKEEKEEEGGGGWPGNCLILRMPFDMNSFLSLTTYRMYHYMYDCINCKHTHTHIHAHTHIRVQSCTSDYMYGTR